MTDTLQESEKHLKMADERLQMALTGSGVVGLWDWMVDTDLLHGDAIFARLYGLDVEKTAAGLTEAEYQEYVVHQTGDALEVVAIGRQLTRRPSIIDNEARLSRMKMSNCRT